MQQQYLLGRHKTSINNKNLKRRSRKSSKASFSPQKIKANAALLEELWSTAVMMGRPPAADEFDQADALVDVFGSMPKAMTACESLFDPTDLDSAENTRKNDILVYLALEHFSKRRAYRRMPSSLRRDIKYHFGRYSDAKSLAQAALFSINNVELISDACQRAHEQLPASVLEQDVGLTFHKRFLNLCPPPLRIYVGCSLQMYGDLLSIDLIKVHIQSGKVTLLGYDDFEGKQIPLLTERIKIKMAEQDIDFFDYVLGYEPPLLNKSSFLDESDPTYLSQKQFDEKLLARLGSSIMELNITAARFRDLLRRARLRVDDL